MKKIRAQELVNMYEKYQVLWSKKEYYSALLCLAYINECLDFLSVQLRYKWIDKISICSMVMPVKKVIEERAKEEIEKILQILSVGYDFCFEEIALVLSIRNDVDSLTNYLSNRCGIEIDCSLLNVDEELADLASTDNKTRVFKVIAQINRNRFTPLRVGMALEATSAHS
jgi:hypothetical protein